MKWQLGLVPAALVALLACKDTVGPLDPPIVTEVLVTTGTRLFINEEVWLQVSPLDQTGKIMYGVGCSWSTSDATVAAVAENGTVTGVSAGSARITATCDGVSGSGQVDVRRLSLERLDPLLGDVSNHLIGSWGSSATDVFVVGGYRGCDSDDTRWFSCGIILHYDGTRWEPMPTPDETESLVGVWGSSANDVFAVGEAGAILHYDGATWTKMRDGLNPFFSQGHGAVWGSSPEDVFAVGLGILHYDGQTWSALPVPVGSAPFSGIWGSSSTDVFAVGVSGTILHYDGQGWTRMQAPVGLERLHDVWGTSGNNVFAVGEGGTVLHYDGVTWAEVSVPTTHELTGVWGPSANDFYVVGTSRYDFGVPNGPSIVLHCDDTGWRVVESDVPRTLSGLWGTAEDVLLVGSDMTVLRLKP